jgi:hypothetical protein
MRIEFRKFSKSGVGFQIDSDGIKFYGRGYRVGDNMVRCVGTMEGSFVHACDRCGQEFDKTINEKIDIYANDGIYSGNNPNIIEFFDHFVDFDAMLHSEIEAYKSSYLYCDKCETKEL